MDSECVFFGCDYHNDLYRRLRLLRLVIHSSAAKCVSVVLFGGDLIKPFSRRFDDEAE